MRVFWIHLGSIHGQRRPMIRLVCLLIAVSASGAEWKFPCPENEIAGYTAYYVRESIKIDGRLDETPWQKAPKSPRFIDIISGKPAMHDTRAMVLWDRENLYVA